MDLPKPPHELELKNIIDKLAQFVARNGPEFEHMTKQKQKDNPKFSFLFGGEFFNYYQYRVTTEQAILKQKQRTAEQQVLAHHVANQQGIQPWQQPPQQDIHEQIRQSEQNLAAQHQLLLQQQQVQVDDAVRKAQDDKISKLAKECNINLEDLEGVLQPIISQCTKDSISGGKGWIFANATSSPTSEVTTNYVLKKVTAPGTSFETKLHLVYLINDVLHHCARKNADDLKKTIDKAVVPIFCSTSIGAVPDQQQKLNKLYKLWDTNKYFDKPILDQLQSPVPSLAAYQAGLIAEYASIITPVTTSFQNQYAALQKQHQDFVAHLTNQQQLQSSQVTGASIHASVPSQYPIVHHMQQQQQQQSLPPAHSHMGQQPQMPINKVMERPPSPQIKLPEQQIPLPSRNDIMPDNGGKQQEHLGGSMGMNLTPNRETDIPPFSDHPRTGPHGLVPSSKPPPLEGGGHPMPRDFNLQDGPPNSNFGRMMDDVGHSMGSRPPNGQPHSSGFSDDYRPMYNQPPMHMDYLDRREFGMTPPPPMGPYNQPHHHGYGPSRSMIMSVNDGMPHQPPPEFRERMPPPLPYYDLPAGLMVPLVKLEDSDYSIAIDPAEVRLPPPALPSEHLMAAVELFYSPPSHDRARNSEGWEQLGLYEYFKAKAQAKRERQGLTGEPGIDDIDSESLDPADSQNAQNSPDKPKRIYREFKSPEIEKQPETKEPPTPENHSRSRNRSRSRSRSRSPPPRHRSPSHRSSYKRRVSRSPSPSRKRSPERSPTPPSFFGGAYANAPVDRRLDESNKGHQLLRKMGWGGAGLGAAEQGIQDPVDAGEVRDRQDLYKGVGISLNDPYENFRKSKGQAFINRMKARAEELGKS